MILVTHMVVGAAGAELAGFSGVAAFVLGWVSHYVLDAFRHWDYPLKASAKVDGHKQGGMQGLGSFSVTDFLKITFDFCAGIILVYLFLRHPTSAVTLSSGFVLGALGGVFPDFIQFVYSKIKWRPIAWLQKIHTFAHSKKDFQDRPWFGFSIQAVIVGAVIFFMNF